MGSFYVPTRYANNTDFGLLLKVMVWLLREEKKTTPTLELSLVNQNYFIFIC